MKTLRKLTLMPMFGALALAVALMGAEKAEAGNHGHHGHHGHHRHFHHGHRHAPVVKSYYRPHVHVAPSYWYYYTPPVYYPNWYALGCSHPW